MTPIGQFAGDAEAGARAVIQPGGSLRDDEMIAASTGLTMRAKKAAANCGSLPPRSLQKKMLISTTLQRRRGLVVLPLTRRRPTRGMTYQRSDFECSDRPTS